MQDPDLGKDKVLPMLGGGRNGPVRRKNYFRCGENGHIAVNFRNEERCLTCSAKGSCRGIKAQESEAGESRNAASPHYRVSSGPEEK